MFNILKTKKFGEVLGLFFFAFALFFLISLYSHNPSDPSFNKFLSTPEIVPSNTGGIIGAHLSDILIQTFGIGAYLAPIIFLILSWALFFQKKFSRPFLMISGCFLGYIFFCAFLNILDISPFIETQEKAGGVVGWFVTEELIKYFSNGGAIIVIFTFLTISLMMVTGSSLQDLLMNMALLFVSLFKFITSIRLSWLKIILPPYGSEKKKGEKNGKKSRKKSTSKRKKLTPEEMTESDDFSHSGIGYNLPPLSILENPSANHKNDYSELEINSDTLLRKLGDFGITGKVVQALPGPVITMYEFEPGTGVKVSRIMSLSDDLALAMRAINIRIHAPVAGKSVVGIEIPNKSRDSVVLKEIMKSDDSDNSRHKLSLALGKDTEGKPILTNLAAIPHLLIAGATGSGKSVGINSMICSILFHATPEEVKFIMIDPKMLELSIYDGIPHLISPVVTNPKKAANALKWAVEEMERRYYLLSDVGTRNIDGYNKLIDKMKSGKRDSKNSREEKTGDNGLTSKSAGDGGGNGEILSVKNSGLTHDKKLPYIVIVIDELADLMMVASKDVENSLARLAQMARAAGLHLLVATQRPSVDVLTGLIKANFPARISFQVTSRVDSRTILDTIGAERLLGKGDMLFLPPGTSKLQRIHGAFISEEEIKKLVDHLKMQEKPTYDDNILKVKETEETEEKEEINDEYYDQAVELVSGTRQASISMIQRRLRIGYNRAARLVEIMEKQGIVGPSDGSKPREVYARNIDDMEAIN